MSWGIKSPIIKQLTSITLVAQYVEKGSHGGEKRDVGMTQQKGTYHVSIVLAIFQHITG
jgi:hypothetical protein